MDISYFRHLIHYRIELRIRDVYRRQNYLPFIACSQNDFRFVPYLLWSKWIECFVFSLELITDTWPSNDQFFFTLLKLLFMRFEIFDCQSNKYFFLFYFSVKVHSTRPLRHICCWKIQRINQFYSKSKQRPQNDIVCVQIRVY